MAIANRKPTLGQYCLGNIGCQKRPGDTTFQLGANHVILSTILHVTITTMPQNHENGL